MEHLIQFSCRKCNNVLEDYTISFYRVLLVNYIMKYRSRTEIAATILESVRGGTTKTKIMYKAYLSYTQIKEYLKFLLDKGLMEYEPGSSIYRITEKGIQFLRAYEEITNLVNKDVEVQPNEKIISL